MRNFRKSYVRKEQTIYNPFPSQTLLLNLFVIQSCLSGVFLKYNLINYFKFYIFYILIILIIHFFLLILQDFTPVFQLTSNFMPSFKKISYQLHLVLFTYAWASTEMWSTCQGHTFKKIYCPSPRSHQLPTVSQLGVEDHEFVHVPPYQNIDWLALAEAAIAVVRP